MRFAIAALPLLVAACGTPPPPLQWVKIQPTAAELQQSLTECELQAETGAGPKMGGLTQLVDRNLHRDNLMKLCMRSRGWEQKRYVS